MKKLLIKTLGCKVNQYESEAIRNALVESGHGYSSGGDGPADVVVVNTCTVTGKAAMQSRQAVRQAIRANPDARIVVTGCHAHTSPGELAGINGVDLIVSNQDKHRIPEQIISSLSRDSDRLPWQYADIDAASRFEIMPGLAHGERTRPFLKIQDGCDAFCTYCIVPHARGRSRSMPMDMVLDHIARLGRLGYREVVLTGIHIGCYGTDLNPATGLHELLCRVRAAGSIDRVRLSSIEPKELSDDIVDLAAINGDNAGRLCPHFHIPLQSGDNDILARMQRPYTRNEFKDLVQRIVARLPAAAIGVDTLIGFPGETDEAFENTYNLIESLPVTYLHVFPFSARKGTPAYSFKNPVPAAVIKQRCERMRRLGEQKRLAFYNRHVGERVTILVEESRDNVNGRLKGLTGNYVPVRVEGSDLLFNTFQEVMIQGLTSDGVPEGKLVS
jgi:threonylcarbamoyladenosine tRNA methylthiotransferase MtaB